MSAGLITSAVALALTLGGFAHAQGKDEDEEDQPPPASSAPATPATPAKPAKPATPAEAPPPKPAKPAAKPETTEGTESEGEGPTPAPAAPKPAAQATSSAAGADLNAPSFALVGGAPLGDKDVRVHIVEKKPLSDKGRSEVALFGGAQINGKFTEHVGLAAEYLIHIQENVALQIAPMWFPINGESDFNQNLVNIAGLQAQAATALTMQYGGEAGVEATPVYGKVAFYEGYMAHFSIVLNAGVGAGDTRVQLRPSSNAGPATFGDTGWRFLGNVGGGFRVKLGEHVAIRLEVRDLVYTASVSSINGCNENDLDQITSGGAPESASCNTKNFTDPNQDPVLAKALLKTPSSDVLNQVTAFAGVAYIF